MEDTFANPKDYPLLYKHKVRIVNKHPGPHGVNRDDFIRALKERKLWKWFCSEMRCDTMSSNGMYLHDAEYYLNKKVYEW